MSTKHASLVLAVLTPAAWGQKPVISAVVNAASYDTGALTTVTDPTPTPYLTEGSIATIFGVNLASATASAQSVPLAIQLQGTSVTVYGIAAPLFYVSPTQINFQWPTSTGNTPGIVVTTAAGSSDVYTGVEPGGGSDASGIFTQDASGCGPAAVLNVAPDGSTSLNSATNSAAPGDYISIYGTGMGFIAHPPPDGTPAPLSPLYAENPGSSPLFDFLWGAGGDASWEGLAPGFVGLDQANFQIPPTVREGCAVPLQLRSDFMSAPVTISIGAGRGKCADPPSAGYGQITWQKTVTTSEPYQVVENDTLTVSLQASPGRQAPTLVSYTSAYAQGGELPGDRTYFGTSCAIPGYRSLGAGTVTAQAPSVAQVAAALTPFHPGTITTGCYENCTLIAPVQSGQASGLTVYQASLPASAIQPGAFTVAAAGGSDVGAFQSAIQVGAPIQVLDNWAGEVFQVNQPSTITWLGGDPNAWVTVKLVDNGPGYSWSPLAFLAPASAGSIVIYSPFTSGNNLELVIEEEPDPSTAPSFSAPGLSLGGQATWKYTFKYENITVQ
jgi:uncharacterized protein (TIGR03437 family)